METSTYLALGRMADKASARKADAATLLRIRAFVGATYGPTGTAAYDVSLRDTRPIDAHRPGSVQRARAILTAWGHGHAV